jgi:hypothetical protein
LSYRIRRYAVKQIKLNKRIIVILIVILTALSGLVQFSRAEEGFVSLIKKQIKRPKKKKGPKTTIFTKHGWNHYGPGYFIMDQKTGVLETRGGMGLLWHTRKFKDFILELEYKVDVEKANSGFFIRVPNVPLDNTYVKESFEIQINDSGKENLNTGSIYSAKGTDTKPPTKGVNQWNKYRITVKGMNITIELNGKKINQWKMEPAGKVKEVFKEGYIGLQNHDKDTITSFRNIRIKEL